MDGNLGVLTLIPVVSFFVLAFLTKKCILSIMASGLLGYILYYKAGFFVPMMDAIQEAACDGDNNYIVIICLLFGCFVQLLRESKGAIAVGDLARKYVKSEKQVLLLTWLCGIIIFIDDYLSILVTANCVLTLSDEHKTPREMLCYIINTTSAPVCLIIPISAWVVFFSGVFGQQPEASDNEKEVKPHLWAFVVPMAVVIVATLILDDILYGVTIGIAVCFLLFLPTRIMTLSKFCDACYKGLEDMLFIAVVLVTSLFYRESINLIGLPDYLINVAGPYMSAHWLPAISFVLIGLVCFATGNIWSVPALCTPIILPLAASTGASIPLTLGAIISAACFGAQACFYSDVTLMSASACRINNVDYGIAQLPYIAIVTAISFVGYVIAGFVM